MFTVYTRALVQAPWYTRKISQAIMLAQQPCNSTVSMIEQYW